MAPPLGYSKTKKLSASGGLRPPDPRPGALPMNPAGGSAPDPRAFPQLQICHYTTVPFGARCCRKEEDKTMNTDEGSYQLSHVYDKPFAGSSDIQWWTEVNHIIPKKAAETSTIVSKVSRLFIDEFLHLWRVLQPVSSFKDQGAYRTLKVVFHDFPGPFHVHFPGRSRTIYVHFPCLSSTI